MKVALLTNCTSSANYPPLVDIADAPEVPTMDALCEWWCGKVKEVRKASPESLRTPGALYAGISFDTVVEIAQEIGHDNVFVVNRGAGLVRMTERMVPYNFTYDKDDAGSAAHKVTDEKFLPALWWRKVNKALHGVEDPITQLRTVDDEEYDVILVSLNVKFIRLIASDLKRVTRLQERVFIPLPMSSVSFVQRKLRPSCVPYTQEYVADLTYTRYNKAHVVTQKFLRAGLELGDFIAAAVDLRAAQYIQETSNGSIDYEKLFKKHPELLDVANPDVAYTIARNMGVSAGTQAMFAGAWKGSKGVQEIEVSKDEMSKAVSSLRTIVAKYGTHSASTDDEILRQIGVFVQALREENPDIVFSSREVSEWGKLVYEDQANQKRTIGSSSKVAALLRSHAAYLGLEQFEVSGNYVYKVKT